MLNELYLMFTNPIVLHVVLIALTVGVLISLCSSLLGVSLVLKRYSMIGDGLSHVGYGALALASSLKLAGDLKLEISIPIVVAAAFVLLKIGSNSRINSDAAIAMFSTASIAIGTIIFSLSGGTAGDACNSLFGSASLITVTTKDMWLSIVLCAAVIAVFVLLYHKIFAVTFDEEYMSATGVNAQKYNMLFGAAYSGYSCAWYADDGSYTHIGTYNFSSALGNAHLQNLQRRYDCLCSNFRCLLCCRLFCRVYFTAANRACRYCCKPCGLSFNRVSRFSE